MKASTKKSYKAYVKILESELSKLEEKPEKKRTDREISSITHLKKRIDKYKKLVK